MYHIFFIHSLVEGHLGCFQFLVLKNNATMNFIEQMSLWYECASFACMPKNDINGSWGRLIPNFIENHYTDFQSGCTSLHSHNNWGVFPLIRILSNISCHQCFALSHPFCKRQRPIQKTTSNQNIVVEAASPSKYIYNATHVPKALVSLKYRWGVTESY